MGTIKKSNQNPKPKNKNAGVRVAMCVLQRARITSSAMNSIAINTSPIVFNWITN
ncbi:MAG: hypothetical protein JW786_06240 [Desulfobacterales bacterium]|nr:hypothetical protein [Desulfobacterales bacterium]